MQSSRSGLFPFFHFVAGGSVFVQLCPGVPLQSPTAPGEELLSEYFKVGQAGSCFVRFISKDFSVPPVGGYFYSIQGLPSALRSLSQFFLNRETCLFQDDLKNLHLSWSEKQGSLLSKVKLFGISVTCSRFLLFFFLCKGDAAVDVRLHGVFPLE